MTALAIETVLMILNSAHYECLRKVKRAARTRHVHAQSSIDPLAHLACSYLCANILIGYRDDW